MNAHSRSGFNVSERCAAAVIILAAVTCGLAAFAGLNPPAALLAGSVHLDAKRANVEVTRDGRVLTEVPVDLETGDKVAVVSGRPTLRLPGGTVELEPGAAVIVQLPLRIDRANATVRGQGLRLDLMGVSALVDGVVRIERSYSTRISVLSGHALVESLGRALPLTALRRVLVPGPGLLPAESEPMATTTGVAGTKPLSTLSALAAEPSTTTPSPTLITLPTLVPSGPAPSITEPARPPVVPSGEPDALVPLVGDGVDGVLRDTDALLGGLLRDLLGP